MITSDGQPVAVAGVMGGENSEIVDDTDSVTLECATFSAVSVRKTSGRIGLRTDASMRYEKTLDPELCKTAAARFIRLLTEIDGGATVVSRYTDRYNYRYPQIELKFDKGLSTATPASTSPTRRSTRRSSAWAFRSDRTARRSTSPCRRGAPPRT